MKHRPVIRIMTCFMALTVVIMTMHITAPSWVGTPRANAGYFNDLFRGVQEISELPSEVDELKSNYEETLEKLDEAQASIVEAEGTLETYRKQNEELSQRNEELAATVAALTRAQEKREAEAHRTKVLLLTGVLLLLGYFILLRVIRLILRKST